MMHVLMRTQPHINPQLFVPIRGLSHCLVVRNVTAVHAEMSCAYWPDVQCDMTSFSVSDIFTLAITTGSRRLKG